MTSQNSMSIVSVSSTGTPIATQGILEEALRDFQSMLTDDQRRDLKSIGAPQDVGTVMKFLAELDRKSSERKGPCIAMRLCDVLQSVQRFSTVVDTFVASNPDIAALVWGSIKLTMQIAINYTSYFQPLSTIFMTLSKHCPRFDEFQALYPASTRLQRALCNFQASIVRCCKHALETLQRSLGRRLLKAVSQSLQQEFEPDLNDIRSLSKEVKDEIILAKIQADRQDQDAQKQERAAASKHRMSLTRFMPKVEKGLDKISESQIQQSARRSREERQRLLEFLSSYDHLTPFKEACKKRQSGTAEWIRNTPAFIGWYDRTGPSLLWCSGKIGSGKTILCSSVINFAFENPDSYCRMAYFFIQHDNTESLKAETIIRSIIRQSIDHTTLSSDDERQLRDMERKPITELKDWVRLLQQRLELFDTFYILIDGLDECEIRERRDLLKALSSLVTGMPTLRIFVTARDSVRMDLKSRFSSMEQVPMLSDALASDIRLYIEATLEERLENEDLVINDTCLVDDIKDVLTRHADGMFLWVSFLINEICTASCDDDIRQSLRGLPRDLEDTFTRALSRIISRQKMESVVQKVLPWVTVAKRPLTIHELREAVSVEIGQSVLEPGRQVRDLGRIALWSENLLQVSEEDPQIVQFAHSTVSEFVTMAVLPANLQGFHVSLKEVDHFVGEICVTFLNLNDFKTTVGRYQAPLPPINPLSIAETALSQHPKRATLVSRLAEFTFRQPTTSANLDLVTYGRADAGGNQETIRQAHPFLNYAEEHWISHSRQFKSGTSKTWDLWLHMVNGNHDLALIPWQGSAALPTQDAMLLWSHGMRHYALLRHANNLKPSASERDKLLITSASDGDVEVVQIFLETSEDSPASDAYVGALQAASKEGHRPVVEFLLGFGVGVNAVLNTPSGGRMTALLGACEGGHLAIVVRLLSAGADVHHYNPRTGQRALQAASAGGHVLVVQRLLRAGSDVHGPHSSESGPRALFVACQGGHLAVVEELLRAGANVHAPATSSNRRTVLQAASETGNLVLVERLLSAGADLNARAYLDHGRTALQAASGAGHLPVVERLISAGAKVNELPARIGGRTALQAASGGGHLAVVERLLSAGASVNERPASTDGRTALQAASACGHLAIIKRLISAKADIHARGEGGWAALHYASEAGHHAVVEQLLNAGADVEASELKGQTALRVASGAGHLAVVERLLSAGAEVNAFNILGQTALQAASGAGHLEVVERLLSAGANFRAGEREGQTAFRAASEAGHHVVVKLLLSAGAKRSL